MEKNSQKALGFIFILFLTMTYKEMVWDPYFLGPQQQQAANVNQTPAPTPTQSILPQSTSPQAAPTSVSQLPMTTQPVQPAVTADTLPTDAQIGEAGFVTLENNVVFVRVSLLGGRVAEYRLKNYLETLDSQALKLNLIDHSEPNPLPLGIYSGTSHDTWVHYQNLSTEPGVIKLAGAFSDGRQITKEIRLTDKDYVLGVNVALSAPPADGAKLEIEWSRFLAKDSVNFLDAQNTGGFVWFDGQRASREGYNRMKTEEQDFGKVKWVSTTDHYFVTSLIDVAGDSEGRAFHDGDLFRIRLAGAANNGQFQLLGGPKSYDILKQLGNALERNIDFGWTGVLSAPLLLLLHIFYSFLGNYGLAIIALTICVRLLLLPLNAASFRSMKAMQELQPEVQRMKENVKDKQQQQAALMELYKKKGVNPLGGCLPIAIQIPIFFGLYSALLLAIELRHAPFAAWVRDLSAPEHLVIGAVTIPVLVILFVVSMLYQQWSTPSTMDETQKKVMLIMPIVFGFVFFRKMPAGLILYWVTSNIISVVQMRQLRKEGRHSPFLITAGVAGLVFAFAFVLTKLT